MCLWAGLSILGLCVTLILRLSNFKDPRVSVSHAEAHSFNAQIIKEVFTCLIYCPARLCLSTDLYY